jgi:hypothetical protein
MIWRWKIGCRAEFGLLTDHYWVVRPAKWPGRSSRASARWHVTEAVTTRCPAAVAWPRRAHRRQSCDNFWPYMTSVERGISLARWRGQGLTREVGRCGGGDSTQRDDGSSRRLFSGGQRWRWRGPTAEEDRGGGEVHEMAAAIGQCVALIGEVMAVVGALCGGGERRRKMAGGGGLSFI